MTLIVFVQAILAYDKYQIFLNSLIMLFCSAIVFFLIYYKLLFLLMIVNGVGFFLNTRESK